MTSLTERLSALGVEAGKVGEYEKRCQDHPSQWLTVRVNYVLDSADAALEELVTALEKMKPVRDTELLMALARAEAAEHGRMKERERYEALAQMVDEHGFDEVQRFQMKRAEEAERLLAEREGTIASLREGQRRAMDEIGVPGEGYPQNISNAYSILNGDCYQPRPEGGE